MRLALCCLALGALPMPGQVAAIALYTHFQHPPSAAVFSAVEEEVGSIAAPLGLDLEWRPLNGGHPEEVSHLVVLSFQGNCNTRDLIPEHRDPGGLGRTHITDGQVLPFVDVDCDRIRAFLHTPLTRTEPRTRDRILGRAIGRVIAHELYHVLGRTAHHGSGLVDHSTYTVRELTDEETPIDQSGCRILRFEETSPAAPTAHGRTRLVEKGCSVCHGPNGEGTRHAPALRGIGHPSDALELATRLGANAQAMCRSAGQLKIPRPSVNKEDLDRLVELLNTF